MAPLPKVHCHPGKYKSGRLLEIISDTIRQVFYFTPKRIYIWPQIIASALSKIVVFISNEKRQTVLKPLPNGDGLIIDHNNKEALRYFLKNAGLPIQPCCEIIAELTRAFHVHHIGDYIRRA